MDVKLKLAQQASGSKSGGAEPLNMLNTFILDQVGQGVKSSAARSRIMVYHDRSTYSL
jgi:hypothetical protein